MPPPAVTKADDAPEVANIGPPGGQYPPNGTFDGKGIADPNPAGGRNPAATPMASPGAGFEPPPQSVARGAPGWGGMGLNRRTR